jgi:hypothetical protein
VAELDRARRGVTVRDPPLRGSRRSSFARASHIEVGAKTLTTGGRFRRSVVSPGGASGDAKRRRKARAESEGLAQSEGGIAIACIARHAISSTCGRLELNRLAECGSTSVLAAGELCEGRRGPNGLGKRKRRGGDSSSRRVCVKPRHPTALPRRRPSAGIPLQFGSRKPNCGSAARLYGRSQRQGDCASPPFVDGGDCMFHGGNGASRRANA